MHFTTDHRLPTTDFSTRIRLATVADADTIGHVHAQSWRETYPGIVPDDVLAHVSADRNAARWAERLRDPTIASGVFVAVDDTCVVVGFAQGGPQRGPIPGYTGELYALYILRAAQGRGVGRLLVQAVMVSLATQGHTTMLVWVLAANAPARRFYERLGGQYVTTKQIEIGIPLEEVAYGWSDIQSQALGTNSSPSTSL